MGFSSSHLKHRPSAVLPRALVSCAATSYRSHGSRLISHSYAACNDHSSRPLLTSLPSFDSSNYHSPIDAGEAFPVGSRAFQSANGGINPANMWQNSSNFPPRYRMDSAVKLPTAPSAQAQILESRGSSVNERYGQITPPDEVDDRARSQRTTKSEQVKEMAMSKSERARNAANSRHAKKKARKDSRAATKEEEDDDVEMGEDGDVEDKREKYREKNRVAAAKCRAKKKENVDAQEEAHRSLSAYNTFLRHTEQQLRDELTFWRTRALQHMECNCSAIQDYNMGKARQITFGSQMVHSMPVSQSTPNEEDTVLSPHESRPLSSRTQSVPTQSFPGSSPASTSGVETSRQSSFAATSSFAFAPMQPTAGCPTHTFSMGPSKGEDQQFPEFLQGFNGM